MVNVLFVVSTLRYSGPTNQLFNLIENLDRTKFKPTVLTLSPEGENSRLENFKALEIELHSLDLSRLQGLFFAKKRLSEFIEKIEPDLVHTQGIRSDSLLASMKPNFPWFLTSRNDPFFDYPMKFGKMKGCLMAWKHTRVMKECSHVIACSDTIKKQLVSYDIPCHSIQNGVVLHPNKDHESKQEENFDAPVFITVGSLISRKNVTFIIKAFNVYLKKNRGTLIVLGDGPEMEKLKSLAGSDKIKFFGNVSDVHRYLNVSDYFISSSISEGLPNSVLEAFASGLPALLSDIPSHQEIAKAAPNACILFEIDGPIQELLNKIFHVELLFSQKSKEEAKYIAETVFSARNMSQNYQSRYIKALDLHE